MRDVTRDDIIDRWMHIDRQVRGPDFAIDRAKRERDVLHLNAEVEADLEWIVDSIEREGERFSASFVHRHTGDRLQAVYGDAPDGSSYTEIGNLEVVGAECFPPSGWRWGPISRIQIQRPLSGDHK